MIMNYKLNLCTQYPMSLEMPLMEHIMEHINVLPASSVLSVHGKEQVMVQYVQNKPVKWGFKLWVFDDTLLTLMSTQERRKVLITA